jgi:5-deoxy-glucuronate isomerase
MSRSNRQKVSLLIKAKPLSAGFTTIVRRGELGLQYLEFGLLYLPPDAEWFGNTEKCEHVLNVLSGVVSLEVESPVSAKHEKLGRRRDVFEGPPTALYLPPGIKYKLKATKDSAEIAVFSAIEPSFKGKIAIIQPEDVNIFSMGRDNWQWDLYLTVDHNFPAARLIVGEAVAYSGNWSNIPPAKHDAFNPPNELPLEEISFFRIKPESGFGLIRIYTSPNDPAIMDEAYVVENRDTVVIPRGYHPIAVAPGCILHRTWAMAGQIRGYGAWTHDPRCKLINGRFT